MVTPRTKHESQHYEPPAVDEVATHLGALIGLPLPSSTPIGESIRQ